MPAMILGAGLGTRLRPLTDWLAKPMVPIGDGPAVAQVAARLRLVTTRIVVNVHHRPEDLATWAAEANIAVSHEQELLGTAGGVAFAASLLGEGDVVVWNGDIVSPFDPRDLTRAAAARPSLATLAVRARPRGEGNVGLDAQGRIVRLRAESFGAESAGAEFLGIHVVSAALRSDLPAVGCLVGDVYLPLLRRGAELRAHVTETSFVDVGTVEQVLAANRAWLGARSSWAAPDAVVSAPIDGSVVGARARVDAPALRSVVWPGAHVREPIADAIATPHGLVQSR